MADDDEIDILGDFSFNSCFAQNNQGIPSCSNREDTVHPQWLLDSTETNWYDKQKGNKDVRLSNSVPSRNLIGGSDTIDNKSTEWSQLEKQILYNEMAKYGRNVNKISQKLKTKTEIEIQALIDAEYGVQLESSTYGIEKCDDQDDTPAPIREEIVADDSNIKRVVICPPINMPKHPFRKKQYNKSKNSLLKPLDNKSEVIDTSEIFYDEDMIIGSTELIGSEQDMSDVVSKNIAKYQAKVKSEKKMGNHRRKVSRSDKGPRSKDLMKSPQGRQRKDSSLSDENTKSPKMQIVLGSGQALPVSEGEQVIKIEKKKESEPESDIEIDVDSGEESSLIKKNMVTEGKPVEEPIAVPLRKFEPMPKRQKRINLNGDGGYTIMHTAAGDLYQVASEPRRERQPRKQPIHLIRCRFYNAEKPAPFEVRLSVSALVLMDVHAHSSRAEVMGLCGARRHAAAALLHLTAYAPAAAANGHTHCDMDPVSQVVCLESLSARGLAAAGWHHSHPAFPSAPSLQDLRSQRALQAAERAPLLALVTSQHWPPGRTASHYRCFRVEEDVSTPEDPVGYQFSVKLVPDLTADTLPPFLDEVRTTLLSETLRNEFTVDMTKDICPQAKMTYLEKCVSSISHHMRSAGYDNEDPITVQLIQGLRDVFR